MMISHEFIKYSKTFMLNFWTQHLIFFISCRKRFCPRNKLWTKQRLRFVILESCFPYGLLLVERNEAAEEKKINFFAGKIIENGRESDLFWHPCQICE